MEKIRCNKKIAEYLIDNDPKMKEIINNKYDLSREVNDNPFNELVRTIVAQQISTRVAEVLLERLKILVGEISPGNILGANTEDLRACGLSYRKIEYIKSLVNCIDSGTIDLDNLAKLNDDEIVEELIQIKGIGMWSAKMFLIFCLKRENVFTLLDGGLKRAVQHFYFRGNEVEENKMLEIESLWAPYKSYASLYLWESLKRI